MKVRFEVLASVCIKRRKPWRQIVWLGKEKESLFLLDEKRVSVLYIPSGKTKRNVHKLSSLLSETVCLTPAPNGLYLVGVQSSGEVFVWQKDKDELKTIVGLASILVDGEITPKDGCQVFPCPDCSQLLLVLGNRHVFLWQKESHADDSKNNTLFGKWSRIKSSSSIQIPSMECKEITMHAAFTCTEVLGYCCHLSLVFNQQANLCVSSLLVQFSPNIASSSLQASPPPTATWACLSKPLRSIQPGWEPISLRRAYTCQYSHDGQILAVGVNQKSPTQTSVLFISAFTEAVLVSDLRGCGLKDPGSIRGRQYWISDMAWTSDNLFLAAILCNGAACLLSRLGEPTIIFSKPIEMGPAYFLNFSPLISVQSDKKQEADGFDPNHSANSDRDPLHQRFSVSSHPSLPILLYSDGYIVTIVQLPNELSPMIFMRDLVLESSSHLRQIAEAHCLDLTLANAYNLPAGELENVKMSAYRTKNTKLQKKNYQYSFEEPSTSLNETLDSEVSFALGTHQSAKSHLGAVRNMNSGKIIFGEQDVFLQTDSSFLNEPDSTLKTLQLARMNLFSVWKLAASTTELWSANMDKILDHTVHNIVKMFSLLLDCPQIKDLLEEASDQLMNLPAVQTASLFKVVSMYKQLLDLLQFDCQQHHLLAQVLQLSHKTLLTILSSAGLCQSDPRIKTLTGCFTLLKFTEKSMLLTYGSLAKTVQSISVNSVAVLGEDENKFHTSKAESEQIDIQLGKRLTATWKLLYKSVTQFIASSETAVADVRQAQTLKSAIEQRLVELDIDIPSAPAASINHGERLSLDGKHTLAVSAWKDQLKQFQEVGSTKNASRLFHSLLYTYILRNDLITAIAFVDDLIIKANLDIAHDLDPHQRASRHDLKQSVLSVVTSTLRTQAMHDPDMMPCIQNMAIRKVVQTMARFMAAYFSNQMIFIYPPHNPSPLPAVHFETSSANNRIIPKYQEDVAAIIRHQKLDSIWTVERTLEYLLLTGLVCEAVWFADRVGDWKAAYQLSVAHVLHKQLAQNVYERPKRPLSVPQWLTPDAIMKRKLEKLVKDDLKLTDKSSDLTHLTNILRDISLSGVMGFVEVGPWLLEQLVAKLKLLVKQLPPLVTKDFYLPAPPLYLHQPAKTEQKHYSQEANEEIVLREKISSIVQLALCVMNATHLSVAAAQWYVCALSVAQKTALQFKVQIEGPCLDLPDVLYQYAETGTENVVFPQPSHDDSVLSVQSSFRDLCSLVWLLHARDRLSLSLRTREKNLNLGLDAEDSDQWLRESFFALQWAVHMITFSRFLTDEANIYKVVLSLLLDFPSTEDIASILAELLHDLENLHPEVQERLDRLLISWQSVIITPEAGGKSFEEMVSEDHKAATLSGASPRGKSLSVFFHKQCMVMDKVLQKKRHCFNSYEEFVFTENKDDPRKPQHRLNIGSRPFETKKSYLEFLDTFFAVGFSKVLESMAGIRKINLPFLRVFSEGIVKREMINFVERTSGSAHKRHQGLSVLSGASELLARASSQENVSSFMIKNQESPRTVRSVPGRSSGRDKKNTTVEKEQHLKSGRSEGLFRGMNMVDPALKRSYVSVKRYESEPFLDDLDSSDEPEAQALSQIKRNQQNSTALASRYWQSEENIYRGNDARDQGKPIWSLTVSFGKKYAALQQIVEWLEVWGSKSHALGLPGREEILDTAAQIKIQIPAQLIILSLWLLEYKYRQSKEDVKRPEQFIQSKRSRRLNQSLLRSQSPSPQRRSVARGSSISPVSPESAALSEKRVAIKSHPTSVKGQQGQRVAAVAETKRSPNQTLRLSPTLEQNQLINAYTQLLDDPEDSSSIDVSSLASDELDGDLKTTLNAIRRTGTSSSLKENSTLNQTLLPNNDLPKKPSPTILQPKDSSTPLKEVHVNADHRTPSLSPPKPSHQSSRKQTNRKNTNQSKLTAISSELPSQNWNEDLREGIADQLQGVIRSELRRIMKVQHHNVLAMMEALDEDSPSNIAQVVQPQTSSATPSHSQKQPHLTNRQKFDSPKRSKTHCHTQTQTSSSQQHHRRSDGGEYEENKSLTEMMSVQVHDPFLISQAHRRQNGRGDHMREALVELQNLQRETIQPSFHNRLQQTPYNEAINRQAENTFSQYYGPQGGNYLHLPFLPFQAWTENGSQQPPPFPGLGIPSLPLLHINKIQEPEYPFKNLRRFLPQVPPPQTHFPQSAKYFTPPLPPSSQPSFSFLTPNPQFQRLPPPPYEQPLLLLASCAGDGSTSGFPLLRMLSQGSLSMGSEAANDKIRQKEKVEETRQKLMRQFHEHVQQDKESADKNILAHQMLHFKTSDELESARSDKLQESAKIEPDNKVEIESVKGKEIAASTAKQQQEPEMADASTSDTRINQGFALPRGIFDSYIQLGEQLIGPEGNETNAAFQLRMAQAMQQQTEKRIRAMVDYSAMAQDHALENILKAQAATAVTKDIGVDPIQEAVNEYNLKRYNNLIPPDIFMGLRFGDQDSQSGIEPAKPSSAPGRGRSYLNVVDIRASSILRDIPEHAERPELLVDQEKLDTAILTSERTVQQIEALEEMVRHKFAPRSDGQTVPSYDAVTVKLFDQLRASKENLMSVAIMPRSSMTQPKAAMIRRLQDMSDQMKAIDEMSQNIEREYKSSHLLLRTIQDINDSVQRSRSSSPIRAIDHKSKELRYFADEEDEKKAASHHTSGDHLAPKTSAKSPQVSARSRSTKGSRSSGERIIEADNELTKLITEVLVQEGVDLQAAGFSEQMAELLERDARQQIQKSSKMTGTKQWDKLINMRQAGEHVKSRTPYERYQLKAWMTQKFHQRQEEYLRRRKELIEREPKPFKSQSTVTKLDLKSLEEKSEKRISMVSEFMNQRLIEAEHLMGSIIVDKPEIPWGSVSSPQVQRRTQTRSPARSRSHFSPPRLDVLRSRSPGRRKINEATWTYKTTSASRSPNGTDRNKMPRDISPVKSILKSPKELRSSSTDMHQDQQVLTSISEIDKTVDSSTDLIDYARQVLEKDSRDMSPGDSYEKIPAPYLANEKISSAERKILTPKGKSFADVVRMQRPEATRKWNDINRRRKLQGENEKQAALQEAIAKSVAAQNPNLLKDRVKEYGSKNIPGFSPRQALPRRVKTYSERLQEMKAPPQPTIKGISSGHLSTTKTIHSSTPMGPSHSTGQLQNLRYKVTSAQPSGLANTKAPVMMRTFLKSHGPKHKPKTYAEQLQELNPYPHKENLPRRTMQTTVTAQGPLSRSQARTRPYRNPYSDVDYEDLASVMSDWDVDENIRNIIYGGLSSSNSATFMQINDNEVSMSSGDVHRVAPSDNQSDYFDAVMQGRAQARLDAGDEFDINDYRSSVDIHEIERIAELASIGSGSILSVIDWDAVEDLIKDV